jgi:hypothetical protein
MTRLSSLAFLSAILISDLGDGNFAWSFGFRDR